MEVNCINGEMHSSETVLHTIHDIVIQAGVQATLHGTSYVRKLLRLAAKARVCRSAEVSAALSS
jgi:hypothetical protein